MQVLRYTCDAVAVCHDSPMSFAAARLGQWWVVALMLTVALLGGCSTAVISADPTSAPTTGASQRDLAPAEATSGLPTIAVTELPAQGVQTLELIADGGPFPYDRDGVTFLNREGILPSRPSGFYREYTVVTPGSKDRGARRIVAGENGSRFYTDDHYDSFREVVAN